MIKIDKFTLWGPAQNNRLAGPQARPRTKPVRGDIVAQAILIQAHWGKENMSEE